MLWPACAEWHRGEPGPPAAPCRSAPGRPDGRLWGPRNWVQSPRGALPKPRPLGGAGRSPSSYPPAASGPGQRRPGHRRPSCPSGAVALCAGPFCCSVPLAGAPASSPPLPQTWPFCKLSPPGSLPGPLLLGWPMCFSWGGVSPSSLRLRRPWGLLCPLPGQRQAGTRNCYPMGAPESGGSASARTWMGCHSRR